VSQQPHPVVRFEGQNDRIPHPLFCQIWVGEILTAISMVEWEVTRQLSVRVSPLSYLIFLLMYFHKTVCQNYWSLVMQAYISKCRQGFTIKLLD